MARERCGVTRVYVMEVGLDHQGFRLCRPRLVAERPPPPLQDFNANLEGLSHTETRTLGEWERKFDSKYKVVGTLAA